MSDLQATREKITDLIYELNVEPDEADELAAQIENLVREQVARELRETIPELHDTYTPKYLAWVALGRPEDYDFE